MKLNVSNLVKSARVTMIKHSPEILTGMGIAGMICTAVLMVPSTIKAMDLYEEEIDYVKADLVPTKTEVIKLCWKCYIPPIITGAVSVVCLIGASSVNVKRNAALVTAYTLSETALKEYQDKALEVVGEKKEQAIRDAVAKDKLDKNPINDKEVIITEKGNTLCYDAISGRYFKSDIDKIKKSVNELNKVMLDEGYISLNDFYYEIGLNNTKLGDDLGWNVERGLLELKFSAQLMPEGTPCLVIDYSVAPKYEFC